MKSVLKYRILPYAFGLMLMVSAVSLLSGCGEQPTGPSVDNDDAVVVHNTGKGQDLRVGNGGGVEQSGLIGDVLSGLLRVVEKNANRVVGVLGGSLDVVLPSGQSKLMVPPGAVNGPVQIEMDVKQLKVGDRFFTEYEFGPHGLSFNKPSHLTLSLPYREGTLVSLRWLNPETGQWELQASKQVRGGKVQFNVFHFSKYGIS